jgi:hypothetical protein
MESSRRGGYDGYFTWGGALLQPELWGIHPKIAISGHKPPIFIRDNDIIQVGNGCWIVGVRVVIFSTAHHTPFTDTDIRAGGSQ